MILKLPWFSFHITVKLKLHIPALMLSSATDLFVYFGIILIDPKTIR